jgi:uncharacterized protein YigA (DUF484 family)
MPLKSDKQVLLSELGSTFKQTILDNKDNSEDFKEIVELTETLERTRNLDQLAQRLEHSVICGT